MAMCQQLSRSMRFRCYSTQKVQETLFCVMTVCLFTEHKVNMVVLHVILSTHTNTTTPATQGLLKMRDVHPLLSLFAAEITDLSDVTNYFF